MAGSSLLSLIDDIATLLDDVSVMSKVAMQKTAGVLGDDLALNAEQVSGVKADRELPVVWAVALGSLKNKAILVPAALLISYFVPWLILPLLMIGGSYLCFEGFEKVFHKLMHPKEDAEQKRAERVKALVDKNVDVVALEKEKVRGAIRTDFILSAEIIVITLGTIEESAFAIQVAVLITVAFLITAGVYGLVAGIVKLDDLGLYLAKQGPNASGLTTAGDSSAETDASNRTFKQSLGWGILKLAPYLMRGLGIAGTVAMFLVGGGIILHGLAENIHSLEEGLHHVEEGAANVSGVLGWITGIGMEGLTGVIAGGILVGLFGVFKKLSKR